MKKLILKEIIRQVIRTVVRYFFRRSFLLLALPAMATEIRLHNYSPMPIFFRDFPVGSNGVQIVVSPSQVAKFEWPDSVTAYVGTGDTDMQTIAIGTDGIHEITVAQNFPASTTLAVVEGKQGAMGWWIAGFGFAFSTMAWGWILRIYKRAVTHSVE